MKNNTQKTNAYKAAYNRHRRRPSDPNYAGDFEELVDFCRASHDDTRIIYLDSEADRNIHMDSSSTGDEFIYQGPKFGLASHPGFIYVPQALGEDMQLDIAYRSLTEYLGHPHATNIDLVPIKKNEIENGTVSMWDLWKSIDSHGDEEPMANSNKRLCEENIKKSNGTKSVYYKSLEKLSWATTGYHYDWTARAYIEERKSPMPEELVRLGAIFANLDPSMKRSCIEQAISSTTSKHDCFNASASIINYYSTKSRMGGHRDDLELDFTKPVVSLSLGLSAVFLLGGTTKDSAVIPILVRPGDVMLLAGDSRLCYHGMARVIPDEVSIPIVDPQIGGANVTDFQIRSWQNITTKVENTRCIPKKDTEPVKRFLSRHRININLRQVLPHGITTIPKTYPSVT